MGANRLTAYSELRKPVIGFKQVDILINKTARSYVNLIKRYYYPK
jgi:hypothetical protein